MSGLYINFELFGIGQVQWTLISFIIHIAKFTLIPIRIEWTFPLQALNGDELIKVNNGLSITILNKNFRFFDNQG